MGEVRYEEMQEMADVLDLSSLTVLGFPDGKMADLDPRPLEDADEERMCAMEPERENFDRAKAALDCCVTYRDVIEEHDPLGNVEKHGVCFEAFQASPRLRLRDLTEEVPES